MRLFKDLSKEEEGEFRQWARDNYVAFTTINGVWHPVVQDECRLINETSDAIEQLGELVPAAIPYMKKMHEENKRR